MKLKQEVSSTVDLREDCCTAVETPNTSVNETHCENNTETVLERLAVQVTNIDVDDEKVKRHGEDIKRRSEKCCRRKTKEDALQIKHRKCSILDMTTSRSYRHSLCVSLILWTSVLLLFVTKGVQSSTGEDQPRFDRYQKYDHDSEVQGLSPEAFQAQNTFVHFLRKFIQMQQQQQQQQQQQNQANQQQLQMYNNGEDLSESQIDWRKVSFPFLYRPRPMTNDGSKEEDKRGSYMFLCHFKICNLGKR